MSENKKMMQQLRKLLKAYGRYAKAVGGPGISETELDAVFERLLVLLKSDWSHSLDQFFDTAREKLTTEYMDSADQKERTVRIMKEEAALLNDLKADAERIKWFYDVYKDNALASDQCPATNTELADRLRSLHKSVKEVISASRPLPRHKKKKRKRQIARGVTSLTLGVGAFIANTHLPPLMAWSYGVGGGALHQAARDFAGEEK